MSEEESFTPDPGVTPQIDFRTLLSYRTMRVFNRLMDIAPERALARGKFNMRDWRVLVTVANHKDFSVQQIAEFMCMDVPSTSRTVKALCQNGLLEATTTKVDGRRKQIKLTADGLAIYNSIAPDRVRFVNLTQSTLSKEEKAVLYNILDKIEAQIDKMSE